MGTKDFSDWNGRKRKEVVRPAPVRDKWLRGGGKKEKVGIKTMVDRYGAALKELALYWKWRREDQARARADGRRWGRRGIHRSSLILWPLKKLRKLKEEYREAGTLEEVRKRIGL